MNDEELTHMIEEHGDSVEKEFKKSDCYGGIVSEIAKSLRQGNIMTVDFNKVIRDYAECSAEYALESHDNNFQHEPDEEGER